MKTLVAMVASGSLAVLTAAGAQAQSEPWWNGAPDAPRAAAPAPVPPPAPQATPPPAPSEAPPVMVEAQPEAPPPQAEAVQAVVAPPVVEVAPQAQQGSGEWVYTSQYGWIWVPYGSTTTTVGVEPYVYLYGPTFGWRWLASPWGVGPFHYGAWGWSPRLGYGYGPHGWVGGHSYGPHGFAGGFRGPHAYGGGFGGYHVAPRAFGGGAHFEGGAHFGGSRAYGGGGGSRFGGGGAHFGGGGGGHFGGGGHHR